MKAQLRLFLLSLSTLLPACGNASGEVTAIAFTRNAYTLSVGETVQLTPILTGGESAVTYFSSNEEIAMVDSKGLVTALAKGQATILGICNDHIAKAIIEVQGETETKVYRQIAKLSADFSLPAFGLNGSDEFPITFLYENALLGEAYFEATLNGGDLYRHINDLLDSQFIQANAEVKIPDDMKTFIEALAKTADGSPLQSKNYYHEGFLNSFLMRGEKSLYHQDFDFSEQASQIQLALTMANVLPTILENGEDVLSLIFSFLPEGEKQASNPAHSLLSALINNAKYYSEKEANSFTFSALIDKESSTQFFADLGYALGENPLLHGFRVDLSFLRPNEESPFRFGEFKCTLDANLFGESNIASFSLSLPNDKEEASKEELTKAKEALPFE